jgi:hypothetical protein
MIIRRYYMIVIFICLAALFLSTTSCTKHNLRGNTTPSPDGKTYLVIDDDNGGGCGPIKIDGKEWPYKIHEIGPIEPGLHNISCGEGDRGIGFEIPKSTIFHFYYWGP